MSAETANMMFTEFRYRLLLETWYMVDTAIKKQDYGESVDNWLNGQLLEYKKGC